MWLMLQQPEPDDYVVATGEMHTVRELCEVAFGLVGLDWERHVRIDERYFRPTEVDELCGDASKAERVLGWRAQTTVPRARPADARARPARGRPRPRRPPAPRCRPRDDALAGRRVMVTGGAGFLGPQRRRAPRGRGRATSSCRAAPTTTCGRATGVDAALADGRPEIVDPPRGGRRRHRRQPREPGPLLLRQRDHGHRAHGAGAAGRRREVRPDRDRLLVPQVHAGAVPRGRPVERLPGGDERARTAWPRRCCSSRARPTASSTASTSST